MSDQVPFTVEEAVQHLRVLRERIPDFKLMEVSEKRKLVRAANVGISLVTSATNAIDGIPALQGAFGREAPELRDEAESILRWAQVIEEVDAVRSGIVGAITVRRHRLGGVALRVYQVSRQLARYQENADLLPHIDAMKRAGGFGLRRAAETPPVPVAPVQPQPPAPPKT
jgi:hypothetical protein